MRHKVRWWFSLTYLQHRTAVALILLTMFPAMLAVYAQENDIHMPHQEVEHWAKKIGNHIYHLSNTFTYYKDIKKNFVDGDATISENDGLTLVKEMAEDVSNMMKFKVEAVKRIMNVAEEAALDKEHKQDEEVEYYNAKRLNEVYTDRNNQERLLEGYRELTLIPNSHFDGIPVNENVSSVHVPTNVYDKAPDVMDAIRWSGRLDRTFKSNYELDHTLSWQYFGSSAGFLRQYPASQWVLDEKDPDLYDARLRSWYIEAANSPKDMIILLDVSGSMTGLRREIAKHVVLNILETLNENDFVNVFNFSANATELVPCFNDTLVQANLENIGVFKKALSSVETMEIANFTKALTKAFELLQRKNSKYNKSGQGSQCNQAIMLVTDGAPYNFEEIFSKYNWPHLQVRMFTYLIGREETKKRDLKWMACANKGYFVHVTTLAEVREQVLKYIPVMARPMVMYQNNHPHIWTGVYADIADPKQTDWLWELRERKRQMDRTNNYRNLKKRVENRQLPNDYIIRDSEKIEKFLEYGEFVLTPRDVARMKAKHNREARTDYHRKYRKDRWTLMIGRRGAPGLREGYRLMTSVSVPVFDRKKTSNITERVLVNEAVWKKKKREVRTANLLGVAGTDVPIREIEKLVPPYKLGVNGYSFMVNKNGYILYHPDLRPVHEEANAEVLRKSRDKRKWFQDILKPNYNSVDFAEVELIDHDSGPRTNNSDLLELTKGRDYNTKLRRDLIDQRENESNFSVKIHMDNMKRVVTRQQRYFTQKVKGTPFSLGIAMPMGYGKYKVQGQVELSRAIQDPRGVKVTEYFTSGNWSIHPEWVYCEYKYDQNRPEMTPEELMMDFLTRAQEPRWKWRSTRTRAPPEPSMSKPQCDKELVQSMVFDARATNVYNERTIEDKISDEHPMEMYLALIFSSGRQNFGMTTAFVATRSGLTRWVDLTKLKPGESPEPSDEPHIMQIHNRAIDEVWYKRAVDYYEEDPDAYVYSVPFDAAVQNPEEVLVTATRAIFIEENRHRKAPAAVVGVTIKHQKFVEYFMNETYKCPSYPSRDSSCKNAKTCESDYLDCYLLDDNGFIIASEKNEHTGKFFGTLEGTIMESLVQSEVYRKVKIYDYQAVCLDSRNEPSPASILMTPIQVLKWTTNWIMSNIFWVLVKTHLYTLWDPNEAWAYTHGAREDAYQDISNPHMEPVDYKEGPDETIADYFSDEPAAEVAKENPAVEENDLPDYEPKEEGSGEAGLKEAEDQGLEGSGMEGSGEDYSPDTSVADFEDGISESELLEEIDILYTDWADEDEEALYTDDPEDDRQYPDDYEHQAEDGDFPSLETYGYIDPDFNKRQKKFVKELIKLAYINKTHPRPCDKEVNLYKLQNHKLQTDGNYKPVKGKLSNCHPNGCGRHFSVQKVVSTNLILVAVNNLCSCESRKVDIEPVEVEYNETMLCNRLLLHHYRKRPSECFNYHPEEHEIKQCGGAGSLILPSVTMLSLLVVAHVCSNLKLYS
ncbi:voltage-dependent calcium channel subunit alpha-2/delta-3-like isoform X9 [Penaeus japonicus]|uniref:voltage-dependent calcium channel subunit alpha-2/delta-3-like isoform X9 n=1 Tax=Penaeus japonicus TaxID=27405 RepID=UPI001C710984|nr:voltage-dependent calcium channel subunit alpha-2/delta-3-like isoform X9 [Penaeus japonicus]